MLPACFSVTSMRINSFSLRQWIGVVLPYHKYSGWLRCCLIYFVVQALPLKIDIYSAGQEVLYFYRTEKFVTVFTKSRH
jgi:hypothetical protein